jgi:hypothetical protein
MYLGQNSAQRHFNYVLYRVNPWNQLDMFLEYIMYVEVKTFLC